MKTNVIKAGTVLASLLLAVGGGAGTAGASAVLKPRACNTDDPQSATPPATAA
ncbi:hypothetical protein [Streptomyces flaveolus]|uniref:hypothetical protein n=1 Tax=Streptomyces flaveolus TaxID=67297 RepID=UPI0036F725C9